MKNLERFVLVVVAFSLVGCAVARVNEVLMKDMAPIKKVGIVVPDYKFLTQKKVNAVERFTAMFVGRELEPVGSHAARYCQSVLIDGAIEALKAKGISAKVVNGPEFEAFSTKDQQIPRDKDGKLFFDEKISFGDLSAIFTANDIDALVAIDGVSVTRLRSSLGINMAVVAAGGVNGSRNSGGSNFNLYVVNRRGEIALTSSYETGLDFFEKKIVTNSMMEAVMEDFTKNM